MSSSFRVLVGNYSELKNIHNNSSEQEEEEEEGHSGGTLLHPSPISECAYSMHTHRVWNNNCHKCLLFTHPPAAAAAAR